MWIAATFLMDLRRHSPSTVALAPMSSHEVAIVVDQARALQRAAEAGTTRPMLRGVKLGLLCERDDSDDARLFRRAAAELGAHVAHVHTKLSELSTPDDVQHTARMLGRLYDAVECQGVPSRLIRQIAVDADVPVFDGIASSRHPSAGLVARLGGATAPHDNRRFVLQAVLLHSIA